MEGKNVIIVGSARSGKEFLRLMHTMLQQNSSALIFTGTSYSEATEAMKRFKKEVDAQSLNFDSFAQILNEWKHQTELEKPRGVIPNKYQSKNITKNRNNRKYYGKR